MKQSLALYVHIPFCVRKCNYCDFLSGPVDEKSQLSYVEALLSEIDSYRGKTNEYEISSIFFGGGTPSILQVCQMEQIMTHLKDTFGVSKNLSALQETNQTAIEVTIEANPGTLTKEKLMAYRKMGFNRLSLGLQSAHPDELKILGRIHSYEDFLHSFRMAREAGFDNINVDLMSALPGQTVASWKDTVERVVQLCPEHISAYSLIIEEGTQFYEWFSSPKTEQAKAHPIPDEETDRQMYHWTKQYLKQQGYTRYEISNYARQGKECRHNISYWNGTSYLGFGLGAASLWENQRFHNCSDWDEYQSLSSSPENQRQEVETRTIYAQMEEFMFLGLRMMEGISKKEFFNRFHKEFDEVYGNVVKPFLQQGLLGEQEDQVFLTEQGIDVSNSILSEFLFS